MPARYKSTPDNHIAKMKTKKEVMKSKPCPFYIIFIKLKSLVHTHLFFLESKPTPVLKGG